MAAVCRLMSRRVRLKASVNATSDVIKSSSPVHSPLLHNVLTQAYIGECRSKSRQEEMVEWCFVTAMPLGEPRRSLAD